MAIDLLSSRQNGFCPDCAPAKRLRLERDASDDSGFGLRDALRAFLAYIALDAQRMSNVMHACGDTVSHVLAHRESCYDIVTIAAEYCAEHDRLIVEISGAPRAFEVDPPLSEALLRGLATHVERTPGVVRLQFGG